MILLVEDSDDDAELIMRAFARAGVSVPLVRLQSGAEAIARLTGGEVTQFPVAVLLDLGLPDVNGLEVLAEMQEDERARQVPVIVMTSSRDDEDRLAAYDRGAVSFVRKPVDYDEFVRAVKELGIHWSASLSAFGSARPGD